MFSSMQATRSAAAGAGGGGLGARGTSAAASATAPTPASAALGAGAGGQRLSLVVLTQPSSDFYKDEGGKGNVLRMVIGANVTRLPFPIPLRFVLFFESGSVVDDTNILNLDCGEHSAYEPYVLPADDPRVEIAFRLEKVRGRGAQNPVSSSPPCACVSHSSSSSSPVLA